MAYESNLFTTRSLVKRNILLRMIFFLVGLCLPCAVASTTKEAESSVREPKIDFKKHYLFVVDNLDKLETKVKGFLDIIDFTSKDQPKISLLVGISPQNILRYKIHICCELWLPREILSTYRCTHYYCDDNNRTVGCFPPKIYPFRI